MNFVNIIEAQVTVNYFLKDRIEDKLKQEFKNKILAKQALSEKITEWQTKGYIEVSVDSIIENDKELKAYILLGKKYVWTNLKITDSIQKILDEYNINYPQNSKQSINQIIDIPKQILKALKNNGYPFSQVYLSDIIIKDSLISGKLNINKGRIYSIDSIRLFGNLKVKREVFKKLIGIYDGMLYSEEVLNNINGNLKKYNYINQYKPWDVTLLANAALINIYASKINKNKFDAIVGFLPNNQQTNGSLLFTIDAKLHTENALARGEIIDVNWQQIQPQSPRIDISYHKPFLFNSNMGLKFDFNLYKRDSAFLNVQTKIGINYPVNSKINVDIFFSNFSTRVIEPDTLYIITNKKLPVVQDASYNLFGLQYNYNNTNKKTSPTKGKVLKFQISGAIKSIQKNSNFTNIKTGSYNYKQLYDSIQLNDFQLKIISNFDSYVKLGKQTVLKNSIYAGILQTNTFLRNEMYQIGGFKLLRGFDEENIIANKYLVTSTEYRYLFNENSFFFGFTDVGITTNTLVNATNNYIGFGAGLALETKQGILQFSLAMGKQNNIPFNFRETKIHVGLINNF